jgi:hypothetical protein
MTASSTRLASVTALTLMSACAGFTGGNAKTAPAPAKAVAPAPPKPFEYAASAGQYRFTANSKIAQTMMGQTQDMTTSSSRLMSIAMTRTSADTVTVVITIDSMTAVQPMGMPAVGLDKIPGTKFTAKIAPNGSFYSATGPSEAQNALAASMTDELGRALPRLKAILAKGATWTDSLKDQVKQGPLQVDREIITKYSVVGDSVVANEPSWKITREAAIKGSGKGSMQGQDLTIETTGTGSGVLWVSKKGVLMGGNGEEKTLGTVNMAAKIGRAHV